MAALGQSTQHTKMETLQPPGAELRRMGKKTKSSFWRTKWKIGGFGYMQYIQLEDVLQIGRHLCPIPCVNYQFLVRRRVSLLPVYTHLMGSFVPQWTENSKMELNHKKGHAMISILQRIGNSPAEPKWERTILMWSKKPNYLV